MTREPEFRDYLLALRRSRLALLLWVVACAAVVFLHAHLRPPAYRATATLVVLPPQFQTELSPSTLTLKTYETLLLSDSVVGGVAKEAGIEGLSIDGLREKLRVEFVTERVGREQEAAPLLLLSATARRPGDAERTANLWAEALIGKSAKLRTAQTAEALGMIEDLVGKARAELEAVDARITEFSAANDVTFLESKLGVVREKLTGHQGELLDASARLEGLKVFADRRVELLAMIERGSRWVGAIRPEDLTGGEAAEGGGEGFFGDSTKAARRNLLETEREIIRYRGEFDVELAAQEKEILSETLRERRLELSEVLHDIEAQRPVVEELRAQLDEQPQFVELSRAIEDEALWMRLSSSISAAEARALADMKLKTQLLNPVYFDTMKSLVRMEAEYDALDGKKEYLEAEVEALSERVRALSDSLDRKTAGMEYLDRFRQLEQKNYDALSGRYNTVRDALLDDRLQIDLVGARVGQLEARVAKMTAEFNALLEEVSRLRFEGDRLATERDTVAESFRMLSQKAEEARIARAQETADVKLAARAVAPEEPLPRGRLNRALIAAAVALAIGLAFVVASEFGRLTLAGGERQAASSG